MSICKKR